MSDLDTALACLILVGRQHGADFSMEQLRHRYALTENSDVDTLLHIANDNDLKAKQKKLNWQKMLRLQGVFPAICKLKNGNFVILAGVKDDEAEAKVLVVDPLATQAELLQLDEESFTNAWTGDALFFKKVRKSEDEREFGFSWFFPLILKQRRIFIEIIVCALLLHVLALSVPVFFQITFDQVLGNNSLDTLYVLTVGVVIALIFNQILDFLKGLMVLHTSSKLDVQTATKTFDKLLTLPIRFFKQSSVGVLTKHMQQTTVIREFLTGRLFHSLLDLTTLFIYLPILMIYSMELSLYVLGFTALISSVSLAVMRPYRSRLRSLYKAEGERQALLVESIGGMETVKSLALEPPRKKIWDQSTASSIATNMSVRKITLASGAVTGFLQKAMSVVIIFVGVQLVFAGQLTMGELIAFNMLSSRVIGPIVSAIGLISEFQQASLSIAMLGQVMNQSSERANTTGLTPKLYGGVSFENVSFRYDRDGPNILNAISLDVKPGELVGIVGRSGSGKSTVTRLLQSLYRPQSGIVRIDNVDIREIDLTHLRLNMGVVLQESFLFSGTVRDNIAASRPDASFAEIVEAAQVAGADEFIEKLPHGYSTELQEGAGNLSGGQKQRLSIARALLRNPAILIFDEATSALDPESEAIIMQNMPRITEGRTVFMVSHRLSSLVDADKILVVDEGRIQASGTHLEVYKSSQVYRTLWDTQNKHQHAITAEESGDE